MRRLSLISGLIVVVASLPGLTARSGTLGAATAPRAGIDWPQFRGIAAAEGFSLPATWNTADGTTVLWKAQIPGFGLSSPVVLARWRLHLARDQRRIERRTEGRPVMANVRSAQSMQFTDGELEKLLAAFADAWNRHDVDVVMSMMTDDGVFEASAGNHVNGERHEGQQAVRAAYAAVFAQYPDAHWGNARHFVKGDRGVSEWTFTGTLKDGKRVEVTGCDLFTFRNGKIAVKNSFRKNRPPTM
jgi:ketosteroid isomerase-like protein